MRLAEHDNALLIDIRLFTHEREGCQNIVGLGASVALDVAAAVDVLAARIGKPLPHGRNDDIAALQEISHRRCRPISGL